MLQKPKSTDYPYDYEVLAGSPHDHTFVAVDELPADDALALIRSHQPQACFIGPDDETAAKKLVGLLAGFTLAVETAAIYLGKYAAPGVITAYTDRLRRELLAESEAAAADSSVVVRHKEKLLERTLAVTFETLTKEQMHLLTIGALLPADQIALPWLRAVGSEQFPAIKPDGGGASDGVWQQLVESLLSLRLFQPGDDIRVIRIHRLVQELLVRRAEAPVDELRKRITDHAKSRSQFLETGWLDWANRWEIEPLAALSEELLSRQAPESSWLANSTALRLQDLARYSEAEPLLRRGLAIDEQSYGPEHPDVATALNDLALLLRATNRLAEAEPLLRRALAIAEQSYGPEHPNVTPSRFQYQWL